MQCFRSTGWIRVIRSVLTVCCSTGLLAGIGSNDAQAEPVLATPPPLFVDISSPSGVGPVQAGYVEFVGPAADAPATSTQPFAAAFGIGGTVNVTIAGATHYRDYAAITGGPYLGLSNLLSDHALRNANGTLTLTLANLQDGQYEITTYHHNTLFPGGVFDVVLTDANVTNQTIFSGLVTSQIGTPTTPTAITTATFDFNVLGGNPVVINFPAVLSGSNHFSLNGFDLQFLPPPPPPLTPEPSSLALLCLAIGGAGLWQLRRRSQMKVV